MSYKWSPKEIKSKQACIRLMTPGVRPARSGWRHNPREHFHWQHHHGCRMQQALRVASHHVVIFRSFRLAFRVYLGQVLVCVHLLPMYCNVDGRSTFVSSNRELRRVSDHNGKRRREGNLSGRKERDLMRES